MVPNLIIGRGLEMNEKNSIENNDYSELNPEFSKTRELKGTFGKVITIIAVLMSFFHLYTAIFGTFVSILQRSGHLTFAIIIVFAIIKPFKKSDNSRLVWLDYVLIMLSIFTFGYFTLKADEIVSRFRFIDPLSTFEITIGVIAILLLVEATRRTVGNALAIIILFFLGYAVWGHHLPPMIGHRPYPINPIIEQLFYTTSGVFGTPLGVSATFIFMFVLFGKFLEKSGAGQFFIDLAVAGVGKYRGGPAKTAILASAALGTISGSSVANTVTTGAFTIPLMKKTGYSKEFSGAVEAVASTGGQIMPPIMGASAFIMASFLGIPFIDVAIAAIIPALLYFLCLVFQVDLRAKRNGLRGLSKSELPNFKNVLKTGFLFFAPLILIVYLLVQGFSPMRAGLIAIISVLVVTALKSTTRMGFKKVIDILDSGARAAIDTAIACAAAGVVVGIISLTGVGLRFSGFIIELSGGVLLVTLILTMFSSIILGMGLPTVAAYIVQVSLTVPALIELGVAPLAAHLFIFYFACISSITPPVALAAFAAAGIAGADAMKTGLIALRLGISAFIVPYMFVYGPTLLLQGSTLNIIISVTTACIGIYGVAVASEGYLNRHLKIWERIFMFISSITLIIPGLITDLVGLAGISFILILQYRNRFEEIPSEINTVLSKTNE